MATAQRPLADGVYRTAPKKAPVAVKTTNHHLFSAANANDLYHFWLETRTAWTGGWPELRIAGAKIRASSTGSGVTKGFHTVSFQVDRPTADRIAARYKIPRRDRADLSRGIRWKFRPKKPSFAANEPVVIELEVWSDNPSPVEMTVGGRNRGPRNNRFDFEVSRAGRPLPIKVAHDFGGLSTTMTLGKGKKRPRPSADLRAWADLPPGAYTARCKYSLELIAPGSNFARWPDHGHRKWDVELVGDITFAVQ